MLFHECLIRMSNRFALKNGRTAIKYTQIVQQKRLTESARCIPSNFMESHGQRERVTVLTPSPSPVYSSGRTHESNGMLCYHLHGICKIIKSGISFQPPKYPSQPSHFSLISPCPSIRRKCPCQQRPYFIFCIHLQHQYLQSLID